MYFWSFLFPISITSYVAVFVHNNPSVIANTIKRFLRSKIGGDKNDELSGKFELNIPSGQITNENFLRFLVTNYINEEIQSENAQIWLSQTNRYLEIICKNGENIICHITSNSPENKNNNESNINSTGYEYFYEQELENEYFKLLSIPNARTNIAALTKMTQLMDEYQKRGIEMPNTVQSQNDKKWWQFWK